MQHAKPASATAPCVYLVGAGPGDPGLLTLKGRDAIGKADVLVYDRLVAVRLLDFARPGCELVYVGKGPALHTMPQHAINQLIVEKALAGAVVVRLKGGDPFVFGRGGEEAEALREHGIPFEIVPGVTSAVAAPAYAGIPVTHRGVATSFTVITGHERAGKDESSIPWEHVAKLQGTLVFLMGMDNLGLIVGKLVEHGMPVDTPAAVVHRGTWPGQKTVCAPLSAIEDEVRERGIENPSVIVVGPVVGLREQLAWFDAKPLFGKTIVVTRARHQASSLSEKLEELGACVVECPLIEIVPPTDPRALTDAVEGIERYRWIVFTSANGVDAFFAEAEAHGKDARLLAGKEIAVIGSGTEAALARFGITQVAVPESFCAEGLAALIADRIVPGERVLLARAETARDVLVRVLEERGAEVDDVAAYATRKAAGCSEALDAALRDNAVDAVTFTSSSTVLNFVECLRGQTSRIAGAALYSIGPITTQTMRDAGLEPRGQAHTYTIDGLVETMRESLEGVR